VLFSEKFWPSWALIIGRQFLVQIKAQVEAQVTTVRVALRIGAGVGHTGAYRATKRDEYAAIV
jgi:hypothetical protein